MFSRARSRAPRPRRAGRPRRIPPSRGRASRAGGAARSARRRRPRRGSPRDQPSGRSVRASGGGRERSLSVEVTAPLSRIRRRRPEPGRGQPVRRACAGQRLAVGRGGGPASPCSSQASRSTTVSGVHGAVPAAPRSRARRPRSALRISSCSCSSATSSSRSLARRASRCTPGLGLDGPLLGEHDGALELLDLAVAAGQPVGHRGGELGVLGGALGEHRSGRPGPARRGRRRRHGGSAPARCRRSARRPSRSTSANTEATLSQAGDCVGSASTTTSGGQAEQGDRDGDADAALPPAGGPRTDGSGKGKCAMGAA